MPPVVIAPIERIMNMLMDRGVDLDPEECWPWPGHRINSGYGVISISGIPVLVHRVVYEHFVEPLPPRRQVDHECHNRDLSCPGGGECPHRACCNPRHLAMKTNQENVLAGRGLTAANAKKTHCPRGHEYTSENTYIINHSRGEVERRCRTCERERQRKR